MSLSNKKEVLDKLTKFPLVPVFYHKDAELSKQIVKSCYEGGIRAFEFTNRGENAAEVFAILSAFVKKECPEMALGIGTIFTAGQARHFIEVGADFVVQPITTVDVAEVCNENNVLWAPGAATANEVYNAVQLGADIVKLFPGNVLGPDFVKALKGPMPNVSLMVTGGVEPTTESLNKWFGAGITAVGLGSQLFPKDIIEKGEFRKLAEIITPLIKQFGR